MSAVVFWWLLAPAEALADGANGASSSVALDIHADKATLRLQVLGEDSGGDLGHAPAAWACDGGCRLSLPPGRYSLRVEPPRGGQGGGYSTVLVLSGDASIDVVGPDHRARTMGLVAVVGGAVVAGGSAFVLFATLLGHTMGDCESGTDCHGWTRREKINAGLWAGTAAIGLSAVAVGLWIMDRNSPKVTLRQQSSSASRLSIAPARVGEGWGLAGTSIF